MLSLQVVHVGFPYEQYMCIYTALTFIHTHYVYNIFIPQILII